jgi:hypothetical protein
MAASLFRFIGGVARNLIVANVLSMFMFLIILALGGFLLSRGMYSVFNPLGSVFFCETTFQNENDCFYLNWQTI